MTVKKFLEEIQKYYGPYPQGQLPVITAYIQHFQPPYLKGLYRACILGFSSKWNRPPDVAIFEELKEDAQRESRNYMPETHEPHQIDEDTLTPEEGQKIIQELKKTLGFKRSTNESEKRIGDHS